ncbi:metal-dependent hydrolase [Viridibacillus arvi]|uniref:Putative metal-dependent hydrolase AMD00_06195 n=2 Tax=Viridibacillus arvi TaxID=263475 RepID=A0A0M0LPL8_9BACL|nr:metal-dependent hydrolase [Viridibacillus arvi]
MNERFPIGEFVCTEHISTEEIKSWLNEIRTLPMRLMEVVHHLSDEELEYTYREGSWTIRQIVHHIADSHMNAYIRFKLALTEENPIIKPYAEEKWAGLPDSKLSIVSSLNIIESLHERWVHLIENVTDEQLKRAFIHPDSGIVSLEKNIGIYAWHGNHHLAHIKNALK